MTPVDEFWSPCVPRELFLTSSLLCGSVTTFLNPFLYWNSVSVLRSSSERRSVWKSLFFPQTEKSASSGAPLPLSEHSVLVCSMINRPCAVRPWYILDLDGKSWSHPSCYPSKPSAFRILMRIHLALTLCQVFSLPAAWRGRDSCILHCMQKETGLEGLVM